MGSVHACGLGSMPHADKAADALPLARTVRLAAGRPRERAHAEDAERAHTDTHALQTHVALNAGRGTRESCEGGKTMPGWP